MRAPALDGVLPVDKPVGPTSHDIVAAARRALGERRVGHTGTLDPFASGLLLLCVGPATRLAEFLSGLDKRYEATARLGVATDSGDLDGEVVSSSDAWRTLTAEAVAEAVATLRGRIRQTPPRFSAKKVGGEPAHRRARRGEDVVLEARDVTVHALEVRGFDAPDVRLAVHCSSGTYVRALAADLGDRLGVGAHLTALRRTAVGPFRVEAALAPDGLEVPAAVTDAWIGPLAAVGHLPRLDVDEAGAEEIRHGRAVPAPGLPEGGPVAVAAGRSLLAVGEVRGGSLRPRKVFARG